MSKNLTPELLLLKHYPADDALRRLLLLHSRQVAAAALAVCDRHPELPLDRELVRCGALLHDVGIRFCHAPGIHCYGEADYLLHGQLGGQLMRREGLPLIARICERHTGTGLTAESFSSRNLPVPPQLLADPGALTPQTLEEQVVCYADKFFSKSHPERVRTPEQTAESLRKFGDRAAATFLRWHEQFG